MPEESTPTPADGAQRMVERLRRRSIPIGAAILDQKVIAGLGNVYRSELLVPALPRC